MSFAEEPLYLCPETDGYGYFMATIHQKLFNGKYEIIRKLGWGPRCSTWLVWDESNNRYFAAQIFTIAASERALKVEIPILEEVKKINSCATLPWIQNHFWESGYHGSHLCIIHNPKSTSVEALRLGEKTHRLPVHVVQRIVYCALEALYDLHSANIMHGAVSPENIYFCSSSNPEGIKSELKSVPAPVSTEVGGWVTVRSQPFKTPYKPWTHKSAFVSEWPLDLWNLGHAQQSTFIPEQGNDYDFAPETLLSDSTCSPSTDIWMVGCMTFHLLTGEKLPFMMEDNAYKQLAVAQALINEKEIPKEWLNDPSTQSLGAKVVGDSTKELEVLLSKPLPQKEAKEAAPFIRNCLRFDPNRRLTAENALGHRWLSTANACSCGYC